MGQRLSPTMQWCEGLVTVQKIPGDAGGLIGLLLNIHQGHVPLWEDWILS